MVNADGTFVMNAENAAVATNASRKRVENTDIDSSALSSDTRPNLLFNFTSEYLVRNRLLILLARQFCARIALILM